jgi:serine/threonine protein kinase/Tfp pilus assembly protein PilF
MSALQAERHPVDRLAEEFVERYRRGERPAISDYTEKYPELANELQEILAALMLIEEHGRAQVKPDFGSGSQPLPDSPAPVQLGDYRVLREIGRGGMGVVYEAVQESLGRHVALKVLPSHALLDGVRLKRFQHEAQAAARLHHTNIVPIFGVGTAEGVHFYAMQFIQGRGLDEVISELRQLKSTERRGKLPAASDRGEAADQSVTASRGNLSTISDTPRYYRSVATLGAQVSEALDHAHRHGVMHRDIKPSNLLLDAAGAVWITDFGLAKADGTEELTHSGDLVGTLRYMAPEQLRGKADPRADIYSLGSTLYELLTLRPAFDAPDRAALIRQIVQDDPPRPRKVDARIPRDLETIVLKAMAHEPVSRYATAAEMAADLRRFLDDKPIAARPVGLPERLWRWCVRRPALATLAAALLLSLAIGIPSVLWQWGRAEANLKEAVRHKGIAENMLGVAQHQQQRAEQNLEEANRLQKIAEHEAAEAEASYQTAREAVNELLTTVSENELLAQPGLQPVRLQLLTRALEFHQKRLVGHEQDAVARRDLAQSYLRLGTIKRQLGPTGEATDAYRKAISLPTPTDGKEDSDHATTILLARAEIWLGWHQIKQHDRTAARATLGQARERLESLLAAAPNERAAQATLAMTFNNLGYLMSESVQIPREERFEDALELHNQALAIYRRLADRNPKDQSLQLSVSTVLSNMARRHQALTRYDEARTLFEECLRIRQDILRRQPGSLELQREAAAALNGLGDVIRDSKLPPAERLQQAVDHYQRSLEIQERLVRENPAVLTYRQDLGNTTENIADLYARYGDIKRALEWRRRDITVWDACLTLDPGNAEVRALRAMKINEQGAWEEKLGLYADALSSRLKAREAWREIEKQPAQLAANRAKILLNVKDLMIELGKQDRASELCALAGERQKLAGDKPADLLALSYDLERAFRAVRRGPAFDEQYEAKTAAYQQLAVELFREAGKQAPEEAGRFSDHKARRPSMLPYFRLIELDAKLGHDPDDATSFWVRGRWLQQLGDIAACRQDFDQALVLLNAQLKTNPNDVELLTDRAWLHLDEERWEEVVADVTAALVHQPNDFLILRLRAWANTRLAQWQRAYDDFTTILQIVPEQLHYRPERIRAAVELGLESEALADANSLVELAEKNPKSADSLVTEFMLRHLIHRFPEATLALAKQAVQRHPKSNLFRGELGGVQFYLGQYRDAVKNLEPNATDAPSPSSASAGFWLAMSLHHLGELEKAQVAFRRAVRNWKGMAALRPEEETFLQSLWSEAAALLAGDAPLNE